MIIDCDGCTARPLACSDCVVTVLLGMPSMQRDGEGQGEGYGGYGYGGEGYDGEGQGPAPRHVVELDAAEQVAVGVLAAAGLVPPLRLVEAEQADQGEVGRSAADPGDANYHGDHAGGASRAG